MKVFLLFFVHNIKFIFLKIQWMLKKRFQPNSYKDIIENIEFETLLITHRKGGGTEQYVQNFLQNNRSVLLMRNITYGKDLYYLLENTMNKRKCIISKKEINKVFNKKYSRLIVNSLVGYSDVDIILNLVKSKKSLETKIIYMVHDFHCVCPKCNLVARDWYCSQECDHFKCKFTIFYHNTCMSIKKWRFIWNNFLLITDSIFVFSESSKNIVQQVYKEVLSCKFVVRPHDMSFCNFQTLDFSKNNGDLKVAIVGACYTIPKGKKVVESIFKNVNSKIPFVMIGTNKNQFSVKRDNVLWYGAYIHDDLPKIIKESEANVVIFPSVCPETFSYLISELMQIGIKIISFNFGAQGEKVKKYDNGIVCTSVLDVCMILNKLMNRGM